LIAFERTAQALDAAMRGTNLEAVALRQLGRMRNSASNLYGYLERAVRLGYLSPKELQAEFEQARKADQQ
jgi:hypothetical protein